LNSLIMDKYIKELEQKINMDLNEREQMIFKYAYICGKQELENNNSIITKVINKVVGGFRDLNFRDSTKSLAKDFNLDCKIEYITTLFRFPCNSVEYRITLKGRRSDIDMFCQSI